MKYRPTHSEEIACYCSGAFEKSFLNLFASPTIAIISPVPDFASKENVIGGYVHSLTRLAGKLGSAASSRIGYFIYRYPMVVPLLSMLLQRNSDRIRMASQSTSDSTSKQLVPKSLRQ